VSFFDPSGAYSEEWYSDKASREAADVVNVVIGQTLIGIDAQLSSPPDASDTVAPVTKATVAPLPNGTGWSNGPVTVTLAAEDNPGGSGMVGGSAKSEHKVDSGAWTTGVTLNVAGDGTHTVSYRSTDAAGNVEAAKSVTVKIDTEAPTTTVTGVPSGWVNHAVTLGLSASDVLSGVASCEYALDGGAFTQGHSVTISAPGTHTVSYRSTDAAGNVEAAKSVTVKIDTGKPVAAASRNVTAKKGRLASLPFTVTDAAPSCGRATVRITIKLGGRTVKTITVPNVTTNRTGSHAFLAALRPAIYTWTVRAADVAGNTGRASAPRKLVVR